MTLTKGRIDRAGRVVFHDASLAIWEEGIAAARDAGGFNGAELWERQFKREVFARIVQTLRRIGWTCIIPPDHIKQYGKRFAENFRYCTKGDLQADLNLSGRHIDLKMFQNVNAPERPDHGGRYQHNQERHMPYLLRLEMERTRRRIRDYLCNVFTGYEFQPPKIRSPNPSPLAYFNDSWDGEHEKKRCTHRFKRDESGWPSDAELASWSRKDKDGAILRHGDVRWLRDRKGQLLRGRVYGGINGMWMLVYGPGKHDHTHESAGRFFTYQAGETPRKLIDTSVRQKRLEKELAEAVKVMKFERAAVLRDILHPGNPHMRKAA